MTHKELTEALDELLDGLDPLFTKIGEFFDSVQRENERLEAENKAWKEAVETVKSYYPEKVFPPGQQSSDATHGTMARDTCDNIVKKQEEILET